MARPRWSSPEARRAYHRRFYNQPEQKAKRRAYDALYRERNRERRREKDRARYRSDPTILARNKARNVRVRKDQRAKFFARKGTVCVYCRADFRDDLRQLTVDHIVARTLGGSDDDSNLVPACFPCNRKKGTKSYDEYMAQLHPDHVPSWVTGDERCTERQ